MGPFPVTRVGTPGMRINRTVEIRENEIVGELEANAIIIILPKRAKHDCYQMRYVVADPGYLLPH